MQCSQDKGQGPSCEATVDDGYEIIERNRQRVYLASAAKGKPPPPSGSEVFVGNLPKNMSGDELIPLFESIGPLYQFRVIIDVKRKNQGYAFATYFNKTDADSAVKNLEGYRVGRANINVFKSMDNRRLFINHLPVQMTQQDLQQLLENHVKGVVGVIMHRDYANPCLNRGFAFVDFQDQRLAAIARSQFSKESLIAGGRTLQVDWANPLPDVDPQIMTKVNSLFLNNLPINYTSEKLRSVLSKAVGSGLKKVHKIKHFAFANFGSHRSAEIALDKLRDLTLADSTGYQHTIKVEWAKPKNCATKLRMYAPPENFCMSVPAHKRKIVLQQSGKIKAPPISEIDLENDSDESVAVVQTA